MSRNIETTKCHGIKTTKRCNNENRVKLMLKIEMMRAKMLHPNLLFL